MSFLDSAKNMFLDAARGLVCNALDLLNSAMDMMQIPDVNQLSFAHTTGSNLLEYMFYLMNIYTGLGILISAYITRFYIRRLPFIG